MKLYDCFQFFNELDILEIRLELLYPYVDYFVISETSRTHSDKAKPYFFDENKQYFKKYLDKIIHIKEEFPTEILKMGQRDETNKHNIQYNIISKIYDFEESEGQLKQYPTFCRDYLQREFLKYGLLDCQDDDLIMVSDLDEIPKPEVVKKIKDEKLINYCVMQDCFNYYINNLSHTNWYGNYVVEYKETKSVSLTHLRNKRVNFLKIDDGGWHLSYMGGEQRIKTKIESYAHQEFNHHYYKDQISNNLKQNRDILFRNNGTYPGSIQKFYFDNLLQKDLSIYPENIISLIKEKYGYLIK